MRSGDWPSASIHCLSRVNRSLPPGRADEGEVAEQFPQFPEPTAEAEVCGEIREQVAVQRFPAGFVEAPAIIGEPPVTFLDADVIGISLSSFVSHSSTDLWKG
jgi:hypothetical protein